MRISDWSSDVCSSDLVSIRPQVAALTNKDGDSPICERQSPWLILSRIRASRVALSGMRNKASARHISATPSWLDRENSWIKLSTPPPLRLPLRACTRRRASAWIGRASSRERVCQSVWISVVAVSLKKKKRKAKSKQQINKNKDKD